MPFPFTLPTTSTALLTDFFSSATHPSLPLTATTKRSVVKDALKKYKRLPPQSRAAQLSSIQEALNGYIPYLLAINTGSSYRDIGSGRLDVEFRKALEVEWRTTLSATLPGREAARPRLTGVHHEIAFTLSALAYVQSLLARALLKTLYGGASLTPDQRTAAATTAMKHLLEAHSIHSYLLSLPSISAAKNAPVDVQPSTISALASLALAEATLVVVSKDDPYSAAVADDRDDNNTDWMYKAPTIKKVRAHLFARICLAAADHAGQACSLLASGKVDEDLVKYANDLRRTARGKAIRFLAIDAELSDKTGEALAWLKGAKKELGFATQLEDGKRKGFKGLKQSWQERREDRKIEKGTEWGLDAGRFEEIRIVDMLEAKWEKENDTIIVQTVPAFEPLLANLPSGREYHTPQVYQPPTLEPSTLAQMRAPPDPAEYALRGDEEDSGGEEVYGSGEPVGAFPGTANAYGRSATSSSYY